MKTRQLKSGEAVTELPKPVTLKIYTKCPEKYMLVDRETGEKYVGYMSDGKHSWRKLEGS